MIVRNGFHSTDGNHRVTKTWLPQKARFYAGLQTYLRGVTKEPLKTRTYIQKKIFYVHVDIKNASRVRKPKKYGYFGYRSP
nr:MAG TPA: hypothetical protein [Caudoviricetes sp.]